MIRARFTPPLLIALALGSTHALAGYTFQEDELSGEVNLTAGGAYISTRNVNFGVGRVDIRNGENTGTRADWQEAYVKPVVTFNYALNPDFDLLGGGSVVVREIRSGKTPGVGLAVTALLMLKGGKGKFFSKLPCMLIGGANRFWQGCHHRRTMRP